MKQRKLFLLLLTILLSVVQAFATHNRAGEITYRHISGNTFEITITTYTKESSIDADRNSLTLFWRTTNNATFADSLEIFRTNGTDATTPGGGGPDGIPDGQSLSGDIKLNIYRSSVTFVGLANYVIAFIDPNRIGNIINMLASVDVTFYLEDTLFLRDPSRFGYNSSVQLLSPPIDYANLGVPFVHNPNPFDPDSDSLRFRLIEPLRSGGINVPQYKYPDQIVPGPNNNFKINPLTGIISWDAPQRIGVYNVAFEVTEYRRGALMGTVIRDFQIIVEDTENEPPTVNAPEELCAIVGKNITFTSKATDPNGNLITSFVAEGQPMIVSSSPATFTTSPSNPANPRNGTFNWQTNCSHITKNDYSLVLRAVDNGDPILTGIKSINIKLYAPPPQNVVANYVKETNTVNISWDNIYNCSSNPLFKGFAVWRKKGCDDVIDTCNNNLFSYGYELIGTTKTNSFIDKNLSKGNEYNYRVTSYFASSSPLSGEFNRFYGFPSEGICINLPLDIPLIYNVDVIATNSTNGQIKIQWTYPRATDLDTLFNVGPYITKLERANGINGNQFVTLNTYKANNFNAFKLIDSSYIDEPINTLSQGYTYRLIFYCENGTDSLGLTSASSVFASSSPINEGVILSWDFNVPWINSSSVIYKLNKTTLVYDSIGATNAKTFTEEGLNNEEEYCYYIQTIGAYSKEALRKPLINNSQIICEIPVDDVPPCILELNINNLCKDANLPQDEFKNYLTWKYPTICEYKDALLFYIYYKPNPDAQFEKIDSTTEFNYTHELDNSLTGCYAVSGIDKARNESALNNLVCTANCPDYKLPNAFTPNSDGNNDLYTPIKPYRFIGKIDIKIYNRWGNLVFETENPDINWDGTDMKTSKLLNSGVYFYTCKLYEETPNGFTPLPEILDGFIHLFR